MAVLPLGAKAVHRFSDFSVICVTLTLINVFNWTLMAEI